MRSLSKIGVFMKNEKDTEIDNLIDNFDFKPITEGLGFHHSLKDEKEIRVDLQKQSKLLKSEFETRTESLQSKSVNLAVAPTANMGDLSPFYETPKTIQTKTILTEIFEDEVEDEVVAVEASLNSRFYAWAIDFLVLVSVLTLTFASIIFFAELPLEVLNIFMVSSEIPESFLAIFLLFFLFYFTFLDKTEYSTLGKRVVGIKVVGTNNENIKLTKSFLRVLISMTSVLLLGLPLILRMQDRLTETSVINKYE